VYAGAVTLTFQLDIAKSIHGELLARETDNGPIRLLHDGRIHDDHPVVESFSVIHLSAESKARSSKVFRTGFASVLGSRIAKF
jgi:hypothetical protein